VQDQDFVCDALEQPRFRARFHFQCLLFGNQKLEHAVPTNKYTRGHDQVQPVGACGFFSGFPRIERQTDEARDCSFRARFVVETGNAKDRRKRG
jgi:hypothetical protein